MLVLIEHENSQYCCSTDSSAGSQFVGVAIDVLSIVVCQLVGRNAM
jgi:hypothetical protein